MPEFYKKKKVCTESRSKVLITDAEREEGKCKMLNEFK